MSELDRIDYHRKYKEKKKQIVKQVKAQNADKRCEKDLNYHLINYCELKFNEIWSEENVKARKWEIKQRDFYFRLVKQGSILVYLTSHILVLFVILLMATFQESLIGLIYVATILLCFYRTKFYAGDVLV